jgi:hypothetical protein
MKPLVTIALLARSRSEGVGAAGAVAGREWSWLEIAVLPTNDIVR